MGSQASLSKDEQDIENAKIESNIKEIKGNLPKK